VCKALGCGCVFAGVRVYECVCGYVSSAKVNVLQDQTMSSLARGNHNKSVDIILCWWWSLEASYQRIHGEEMGHLEFAHYSR
jgi:hypothetical protein